MCPPRRWTPTSLGSRFSSAQETADVADRFGHTWPLPPSPRRVPLSSTKAALYTRTDTCYGGPPLIVTRRRRCYAGTGATTVNTTTRGTFECPTCRKTYKWYRGLHRHLKYECGKAPRFRCPHCIYTGKHRSHVYSHIKSNHHDRPVYALDIQQG